MSSSQKNISLAIVLLGVGIAAVGPALGNGDLFRVVGLVVIIMAPLIARRMR